MKIRTSIRLLLVALATGGASAMVNALTSRAEAEATLALIASAGGQAALPTAAAQ